MRGKQELVYDGRMNAGAAQFKFNYSSLWHLWKGGARLWIPEAIVILRDVLWIDISKWQGMVDFLMMAAAGAHGLIIKCGQGTGKDIQFENNKVGSRQAGIPRSTYWYYDSRVAPKLQAFWWWEWLKGETWELMHFADYEESYGGAYGGWVNFKIFLQEFQRLSGLPDSRIGIYTSYYYWISHSPTNAADLAWFGRFGLWEAWYTSDPSRVVIPKPWDNSPQKFVAWQFGTPSVGPLFGADSAEIDQSNFNGDMNAYIQRFNLGGTPPPNGGAMYIEVTATRTFETRSIRNGPSIMKTKIADLPAGGVARSHGGEADIFTYAADVPSTAVPGGFSARAGDQWIRIYEVNGVPVTNPESWLAVIHLRTEYTLLKTFGEEPSANPRVTVTFTDKAGVVYELRDVELPPK